MNDNLDALINRRSFLRRGSCAAMGLAGITSQLFNMRSMAALLDGSVFADYRALVCVFLFGGNDSGNTVIPLDGGPENYEDYAAIRGTLAVGRPLLEQNVISPVNTGGRRFGLHPAMADVAQLFEQGNMSILANVGTLVVPTTKAQYNAGSVVLPRQLFAHNVQQEQWQASRPDAIDGLGWGGRIADLLQAQGANPDASVSMNISLAGQSQFLAGRNVVPYSLSNPATAGPAELASSSNATDAAMYTALIDMFAAARDPSHPNPHAMQRALADVADKAVINGDFISDAVSTVSLATPLPPNNSLATQLSHVARLIAIGRTSLRHQRQIFFVSTGGFDNHDGIIGTDATDGDHASRLSQVNAAIKFFWGALGELGMRDSVTTFTASDFGRTLNSNGNGSDHAWGGHHFVMGGSQLRGRRMFGSFPVLAENGPDAIRRGTIIPTTAVDEYGFEFARWLGVPMSEAATVFPNITRFLNPLDPATHLGMLV